jgi:uroporphyrinogen III methyltransferase / synthase
MSTADKPLAGKRIVVTRQPERAQELVQELQQAGAEVLLLSTIGTADPLDSRPLDDALQHVEDFNAILFVSRNAVGYTFKRAVMLRRQNALRNSQGRLVAAVGATTAEEAARHGMKVDHVASVRTGESLVQELGSSLRGRKVFLPRSDRGDKRLADILRDAGAEVTEVVAYQTTWPEPLDAGLIDLIRAAEIDVLTFASPSAYDSLCESIEKAQLVQLSNRIQFAAIGPITAGAIRKKGSRVEIVASEPSARGFADAIVKYYVEAGQTERTC